MEGNYYYPVIIQLLHIIIKYYLYWICIIPVPFLISWYQWFYQWTKPLIMGETPPRIFSFIKVGQHIPYAREKKVCFI